MDEVGESNDSHSSLSSRGSPPDKQDGLFRHEHPRINFLKWLLQYNVGEPQSYENYVRDIISVDVQTATGILFYMEVEKKECDCYFFQKSQKKCFHVLSPVSKEDFMEATAREKAKNLRPMLLCNRSDTEVLFNLLEQVTLVDRYGTRKVRPSLKCKRCKYVISSGAVSLHKCSTLAYPIKPVWRYKLPFTNTDGKDIVLDDSCIPLCSAELHHLIPTVSQVYEKLEALEINTSLVQILAQDPKYQESMDIFEYQKKDREFGTYHLYLYLVHRLLPFLAKLSSDAVDMKFFPIFTIVRPNESDLIRDVTGFVENEVEARLNSCPQECLEIVQKLFHDVVTKRKVMESENVNKTEEMEAANVKETIKAEKSIDLLKLIDYDDILETMLVGWLKSDSMKDVVANLLRCLDVKEPVDKFVRVFATSEVADGSTEWKIHNQFFYGETLNTQKLTNIFNVIPKARVSGKLLKNALLFSKGRFNYKSDEPWRRGTKRSLRM